MQGYLFICPGLAGKTWLLTFFITNRDFGTGFAKSQVTVSLVVNNRVMVKNGTSVSTMSRF